MVSHLDVIEKFNKFGRGKYFKSWLTRNKFVHIGNGITSNVYSSSDSDFVVKVTFPNERLDYPKHRHHPLFKRWVKPLFVSKCNTMMIQPKVNTAWTARKKAFDRLNKIFGSKICGYDVHTENVGMYKGKAVIFDCGHYQ